MSRKKTQSSARRDAAQDTTAHASTAQETVGLSIASKQSTTDQMATGPSIVSNQSTAAQSQTAAQGPEGQHKIKISIPLGRQNHDGLVKRTLLYKDGKCLKALIKNSLPEHKLKHLDLSDFKIENPEDFDDDQNPLRADFVVSVGIKGSSYRATVVLLIEHKSYLDHGVLIQVLRYQIPIIRKDRLPLLTIVIFHNVALEKIKKDLHQTLERKHPVLKDPEFRAAFQENILNFNCEWVDLTTLTENLRPVLEEDEALTLQMLSCTLKYAKTKDKKQQVEAINKVLKLGESLSGEDYKFLIEEFLHYMSLCGYQDSSFKEAENMKGGTAARREIEALSMRELWGRQLKKEGRQEGIEAGRQEGIEAGRQEEEIRMLTLMLKRGSMQDVARLTGLSIEKLQKIKNKSA